MGTEESNKSTKPCNIMVAEQDETINKPLHPHWSTTIQGYYYPMSTPTPFINSYVAGSYYYPHIWPNQSFSAPFQYDSLHDPNRLKNHPTVAGGSALSFSDKVQRTSVKNTDSIKTCEGNLQPISVVFKELRENGNELSISKNEQDGATMSAASGSMKSSDEDHDTNNGLPSSRKQQCKMMLANGDVAQDVAGMENCSENCVNKSSALQQSAVNSTELNLNSGTCLKDEDEIRKERKRKLNRESARRSRLRRQQECDELHKTMGALAKENSLLKDKLMSLSEDCLKLNNENNSIEEEVVKKYGLESIADLAAMKPGGVTS